ncbi:melanoma-associated antigen B1-like [Pteronotus mesoamericanus]|uniref:melanoma-associated antigen B1-like n=1 Tax=Pteronotus mesoamericanus TaxID=1884717 RepID=UPI0023EB278B|nr:melanoma-associated antigen B1-like [Pteronotus parnellii mesoamericanus]
MPRGQKSKLRAREKRRQARSESQSLQGAQAMSAEAEGVPSSPSPPCGDDPQSSPAAGSGKRPPGSRAAPSAPTPSAGVSCASQPEEGAASQPEEGAEGQPEEGAEGQREEGAEGQREEGAEGQREEGAEGHGAEGPDTSQAEPSTEPSGPTPLEQKAILLVQFMLRKHNMREPIRKEDMMKYVIRKHKQHFYDILRKASELMVLAFGMDIKDADPAGNYFILVSKLRHARGGRLTGEIVPKRGLLMTILCVIFMKGNCAAEEDIWDVLNVMGIYAGKRHFIHGEPKKLITQDLVRERYLEYRQVLGSDPPRYEFLWGPRAQAETSKLEVLEFLAKLHDTHPRAFPLWYEEALRDEEERARARSGAARSRAPSASVRPRINFCSSPYRP